MSKGALFLSLFDSSGPFSTSLFLSLFLSALGVIYFFFSSLLEYTRRGEANSRQSKRERPKGMGIKRSLPYRHKKKGLFRKISAAAHNDFPIRNNKTREFAHTHIILPQNICRNPLPPFCPIPTWTRNSLFSFCDWMAGGWLVEKKVFTSLASSPSHPHTTGRLEREGEILAFSPESWS